MHLLPNEKIEYNFSPHPLSFFGLHLLWLFFLVWGTFLAWLTHSTYWSNIWSEKNILSNFAITIIWLIGVIGVGIVASILMIRWHILIIFFIIAFTGLIISIWLRTFSNMQIFIPIYSFLVAILGFVCVEIYRRSHEYIITNFRLILRGGIIRKRERTLRYDKITDLDYFQGMLGRIFKFGNIIPITQSGFGLGSDAAFAGAGTGAKVKKIGLFGFVGGSREVQTPRARSYYEMHGAHPIDKIKLLIEKLVQEATISPYQKRQVDLQQEILEILRQLKNKKQ